MPSLSSATYVVGPNFIVTTTVANLRLVDKILVDKSVALLTDQLAGGTAAVYVFNGTSTTADNGTTVIKPASMTTGRWMRCGSAL